ncbi:MAG: hypothetical protein WC069_01130 [Candidatus Shapirobacteria bacterium]
MTEQRTATVRYRCARLHENMYMFGEKPNGYPDNSDKSIEIRISNFFEKATLKIEAWCPQCRARVTQTRIDPQPE